MNIVEQAIERSGGQVRLAEKLTELTTHPYTQPHISNWKKTGHFPPDIAAVVVRFVFDNEISLFEACPTIKRAVSNG